MVVYHEYWAVINTCVVGGIRGTVVARWTTVTNRSNDRSYARGMIHYKIHLIRPGCPRPSIALQCRIMA